MKFSCLLLCFILNSCALWGPDTYEFEFVTSQKINPSKYDETSPLNVKFYQLSSKSKFEKSDYSSIYDQPEKTLSGELIRKEDLLLQASQKKAIELELDPNTTHIGILFEFRKNISSNWKKVIDVNDEDEMFFLVDGHIAKIVDEDVANAEWEKINRDAKNKK